MDCHQVATSPHGVRWLPAPLIVIVWLKGKVSALQPRAIHSSARNIRAIER